jgi:hypothetical protein
MSPDRRSSRARNSPVRNRWFEMLLAMLLFFLCCSPVLPVPAPQCHPDGIERAPIRHWPLTKRILSVHDRESEREA